MTTTLAKAQYIAQLLNNQSSARMSADRGTDAPYFRHAPDYVQVVQEHYRRGLCPRMYYGWAYGNLLCSILPLDSGLCLIRSDGWTWRAVTAARCEGEMLGLGVQYARIL